MKKNCKIHTIASLLLGALLLCAHTVFAQIQHEGTPATLTLSSLSQKQSKQFQLLPLNVDSLISLDEKQGVKNRFGKVESKHLDIKTEGIYTEIDGVRAWNLSLSSENALGLSVLFGTFNIPQGANLFVYSSDRKIIKGAFTWENNIDGGIFAISQINSSSIVVEYNEPMNPEFEGSVIISKIAKAYRSVNTKAIPARVGINCPEGKDWQDDKRSVLRMRYFDGDDYYSCTGALINNVLQDNTPFLLTANHCIASSEAAESLVTTFNYEDQNCSNTGAEDWQTLSGAELLATNTYTDVTLLKLTETPPESYQAYFAGWNASGANPEMGTAIHHPDGSPKCISIDKDEVESYQEKVSWDGGSSHSEANTHWITSYEIGADEGGSSGSPLFNEKHQIVGQLHGGNDIISLWGKFNLSWNHNKSSSAQLKTWLDPNNSGATELSGKDARSSNPNFIIRPEKVCTYAPVSLSLVTGGFIGNIDWIIYPNSYSFLQGTNANSINPIIHFKEEIEYQIICHVSSSIAKETYEQILKVGNTIDVRFANGADIQELCPKDLIEYEIVAEGASHYAFELDSSNYFDLLQNENTLYLTLNDEGKAALPFETLLTVYGTTGTCVNSKDIQLQVLGRPENDDIEDAYALEMGHSRLFSNRCAEEEENEPAPPKGLHQSIGKWSNSTIENSVWFTFASPSTGNLSLVVEGINSQIAIYEGKQASDVFNSGLLAMHSAIDGQGTVSALDLELKPNTNYYLQVDGTKAAYGNFSVILQSASMDVYPNPNRGNFRISLPNTLDNELANVSLYNSIGQLVFTQQYTINTSNPILQMALPNISPGLYFVRVHAGDIDQTRKMLIVN